MLKKHFLYLCKSIWKFCSKFVYISIRLKRRRFRADFLFFSHASHHQSFLFVLFVRFERVNFLKEKCFCLTLLTFIFPLPARCLMVNLWILQWTMFIVKQNLYKLCTPFRKPFIFWNDFQFFFGIVQSFQSDWKDFKSEIYWNRNQSSQKNEHWRSHKNFSPDKPVFQTSYRSLYPSGVRCTYTLTTGMTLFRAVSLINIRR